MVAKGIAMMIKDPVAGAQALMNLLGWPMPDEPPPRRPMDLPRHLPLNEKQAASGRRSAAIVGARTDEKLATARAEMQRDGVRITRAALAARAGVCVRTVSRRTA